MVCDLCNDHNTTSLLLCKTVLPDNINMELKSYLRCERCKHYLHKRFLSLSKKHNLDNIIYHYNIKDIKPHLKTSYIKRQLCKISLGHIRYITHCLKFYIGGPFYDEQMIQYEREHEQGIINSMRVRYQVNLKCFFIDFYKELCDKIMSKDDALFMEKYIMKILVFS